MSDAPKFAQATFENSSPARAGSFLRGFVAGAILTVLCPTILILGGQFLRDETMGVIVGHTVLFIGLVQVVWLIPFLVYCFKLGQERTAIGALACGGVMILANGALWLFILHWIWTELSRG